VGYLRRVLGATPIKTTGKDHRYEIRKARDVKSLLRIERSPLHWFDHVSRMPQERWVRHVLLDTITGKRPRGPGGLTNFRPSLVLSWCGHGETDIAVDREAYYVLKLLPSRLSPKEMRTRK